jgi:hypothetical protein
MPNDSSSIPADHLARVQAIAARFADLPQMTAVALAGSLVAGLSDEQSDLDLYIYAGAPIPVEIRRGIAQEFAGEHRASIEIDKPFWGPEDAWIDSASGLGVDLIYWSPEWIEEQVDRVLVRHEAGMGYTTSFWYTVLHSQPVVDRDGWFARLKQHADQPYPEPLRRAIVRLNYPVLRQIGSSYRHQIALAILRRDRISLNHRVTALLASYFDILFAANRAPNPGEKRLIAQARRLCPALPDHMEEQLDALLCSVADPWDRNTTLVHIDALLDALDDLLNAEGLLSASGKAARP